MASIPLKTIQFPDLPDTYVVAPPITAEESGAIASFSDGADDLPVADLTVSIVPQQAGSGTPSPSNVRAISGFTKATVKRAGKNILPFPYRDSSATSSGVTRTVNDDGTISLSGTATAAFSFVYTANLMETIKPNVGDVLIFTDGLTYASNRYSRLLWADTNAGIGTVNESYALTVTQEHLDRGVYFGLRINSGAVCDGVVIKPMVRVYGDSEYEPYSIQTYEVSFGSAGTVYGGTLDVTTGVLTVDRKAVLINSLTWTVGTASGRTFFRATVADKVMMRSAQEYSLVSSNIEYGGNYTVANMPNPSICQAPNSNELRIYDSTVSTVSAMLSTYGTGQVCYCLATPVEYNLTPAEITTLLGVNNIWSDTGDTTVEYRADTKMYIDKKIAEVQALVLES